MEVNNDDMETNSSLGSLEKTVEQTQNTHGSMINSKVERIEESMKFGVE